MSAERVSWARVRALADRLSERDRQVIRELHRVKLLTGEQLERLIFASHSSNSQGNIRRRVLGRLVGFGIVATLERRIGGVRAGSNGLVYGLGRFGQRLAELFENNSVAGRTRRPYTPGRSFLNHTLSVSEAYVSLVELSRREPFQLRQFLGEPACWYPDGNGGWLRPDALVVLENERYEASWWLEIDQGSEHLGRIRAKVHTYERFARAGHSGPSGLLPGVLFAAPDEARATVIRREIARERATTITCEAVTQATLACHLYTQLRA